MATVIDEEHPRGLMDLREKIALLVEDYQWDSGECETEARNIAGAILAIPVIRDALEAKAIGEIAQAFSDIIPLVYPTRTQGTQEHPQAASQRKP